MLSPILLLRPAGSRPISLSDIVMRRKRRDGPDCRSRKHEMAHENEEKYPLLTLPKDKGIVISSNQLPHSSLCIFLHRDKLTFE